MISVSSELIAVQYSCFMWWLCVSICALLYTGTVFLCTSASAWASESKLMLWTWSLKSNVMYFHIFNIIIVIIITQWLVIWMYTTPWTFLFFRCLLWSILKADAVVYITVMLTSLDLLVVARCMCVCLVCVHTCVLYLFCVFGGGGVYICLSVSLCVCVSMCLYVHMGCACGGCTCGKKAQDIESYEEQTSVL